MHILLALITGITGLLYALDRVGIDLGGLNPFYWYRRNKWQKKYLTKPVHQLKKPIEAASVLLVAMVTAEGLVSREQKQALTEIFEKEFEKSPAEAAEMFGGSQFLLRDTMDIVSEVPYILEHSKAAFTDHQQRMLLELLRKTAHLEGPPTSQQLGIIDAVEQAFIRDIPGKW